MCFSVMDIINILFWFPHVALAVMHSLRGSRSIVTNSTQPHISSVLKANFYIYMKTLGVDHRLWIRTESSCSMHICTHAVQDGGDWCNVTVATSKICGWDCGWEMQACYHGFVVHCAPSHCTDRHYTCIWLLLCVFFDYHYQTTQFWYIRLHSICKGSIFVFNGGGLGCHGQWFP